MNDTGGDACLIDEGRAAFVGEGIAGVERPRCEFGIDRAVIGTGQQQYGGFRHGSDLENVVWTVRWEVGCITTSSI